MRKIHIPSMLAAVGIFVACNSDLPNSADSLPANTDETQTISSAGFTVNDINVQNENGVLHFATVEDFDKAIIMLTAPEADLKSFEDELGFQSLYTYQNDILELLNDIDDEGVFLSAVESYKDYVVYDAEIDYVKPLQEIQGYASIANIDGWYIIKDILYQITSEYLAIYESKARTSEPIILQYQFNDFAGIDTRGENWQTPVNGSYTHGKKRIFNHFKTVMYWTLVESTPEENVYSATFSYQVQVSAQAKNVFGKWKDYNTLIGIQKLSFQFEVPGQSSEWWAKTTLNDYEGCYQGMTLNSGKEVAKYTHTFNNSRRYEVYDFHHPYLQLLQYRARSRGTGDCGFEVNIRNNEHNLPNLARCGW